jgi:DNA replication protein DnaC
VLEHPLIETIRRLKLQGMAQAFADQCHSPKLVEGLDFTERLALLLQREEAERDTRATRQRITRARLRMQACLEDFDNAATRGFGRTLLAEHLTKSTTPQP